MRQLTYASPGQIEWRDVPAPTLQDDRDVLVQPMAVTRCDLDFSIVHGALGWEGPFALGHETAGIVVDVGDAVRSFRPGDRVVVPFQISCGECDACKSGFTACCTAVPFRSSYGMAPLAGVDYGGGLSDLMRVPFADNMLLACPDDIEFKRICGIADAATDGFTTVSRHLVTRPGARVLVVGGLGQGIGLLAAQAAKALGAAEVVYLDDDPARLEVARSIGVSVIERKTYEGVAPGSPYPVTVDSNITPEGLALAIRSTAHGGACQRTYGDITPGTTAPLQDMYRIGVSLHLGRVNARHSMPEVLEHVRCGGLCPDAVVTREVPFGDAVDGMLDPTIKVLFVNDASPMAE